MSQGLFKMRIVSRSLAVAVFAVLTSGCGRSIVTYPTKWAPIDSSLECRAAAGIYRQSGEQAPGGSTGGFSRFTILMTYSEVDFGGSHVTLSFPKPDVLLMKAGGERLFHFDTGAMTCRDGKIELKRRFHLQGMIGPVWNYETVTLGKSTDGWLVAEFDRTQWAFLAFIPTYWRFKDWYRFEPFTADPEPK